jgi:polar amino acid transport system substrate-binding protein
MVPVVVAIVGLPRFPQPWLKLDEKMKKRFSLLVVAFLASVFLVACDKKEEPAPVSAPITTSAPVADPAPTPEPAPASAQAIVIGLDDHFPPMGFRDDKGEIVGFDIDLAREAGKRLGLEVTFKPIDWSAKEAELNGKRIDVLWDGLTITEERKATILFTKPYLENRQIIVVAGKSPITTKAGLADKVVGVQDGSSAVDAIAKDAETAKTIKELKQFSDNVTALMDLSAGRLDAIVVDEIVGRYYTAKKPDEYRVLEDNFGAEEYGVGTRKEDAELVGKIDKALDDMKADGSAAAISTQWFGKDILKK